MATILSAEFNQITMQTQYIVLYMTRQVVSADMFDLSIVSIDSLDESLDKTGCVTRPTHLVTRHKIAIKRVEFMTPSPLSPDSN